MSMQPWQPTLSVGFAVSGWGKRSVCPTSQEIAERIRKIGGTTLCSIGHISGLQRIKDNDTEYVEPREMLAELREDNHSLSALLREIHGVCDEYRDIATASLIESWIDETARRAWFLCEAAHTGRL
jgi:starvation-inducible DNA-binding protein